MPGAIPTRKPRVRNLNIRSLANAVAGQEQPYPHYRFSGRVFLERPRSNPFSELENPSSPGVVGPVITSGVPPDGEVSVPYGPFTFTGTGVAPLSWSVVGGDMNLPPGLTLNSMTGVLDGTPDPLSEGLYDFFVRLTDGNGATVDTASPVVITTDPSPLLVTDGDPPDGQVDQVYPGYTFITTNGTGPYSYVLIAGSLPPGLSLTGGGVLSGTPTVAGLYPASVRVTDAVGTSKIFSFAIDIFLPVAPVITSDVIPNGQVLVSFGPHTFTGTGFGTPTWSLESGILPDGMSLDLNGTNVLDGIPLVPGNFVWTVRLTDIYGQFAEATYGWQITESPPPVITSGPPPTAVVQGNNYPGHTFTATNHPGAGPVVFSIVGDLPPGVTQSGANGEILGTEELTVDGSYPIIVTATDALGVTDVENYTILVDAAASPVITAQDPPDGTENFQYTAYQFLATVAGATEDWNLHSGVLPTGIKLTASGLLGGTPQAGTDLLSPYNFRVSVTDQYGRTTVSDEIEIEIAPDPGAEDWQTAVTAPGNPTLWYRFNEASGNVLNYGTQASADMVPTFFGEGFSATYQSPGRMPYEGGDPDTPAGTGQMKFEGAGHLTCQSDWEGTHGTIFFVLDFRYGEYTNGDYVMGVSRTFDIDGCFITIFGALDDIRMDWRVQNAFTGDSATRVTGGFGIDLTTDKILTVAVRKNVASDSSEPDIFMQGNQITGAALTQIFGTCPIGYWFDSFNPDTSGIGARSGVSSGPKWSEGIDEMLYYQNNPLTNQEIADLHASVIAGIPPAVTQPVISMGDTNISIDDGDSIADELMVSGSWIDGTDDLEFVVTHWSTSTSGSSAPAFPGGTWSTIGSFASFMGWDDGTEQPPDGPFTHTDTIANITDPFQDDGGGNWVRVEVTAVGGAGGDSDPFEFFFKDAGF